MSTLATLTARWREMTALGRWDRAAEMWRDIRQAELDEEAAKAKENDDG